MPAIVLLLLLGCVTTITAQDSHAKDAAMNGKRLFTLLADLYSDVLQEGPVIRFSHQGTPIILVYDENADRMRLLAPIAAVEDLEAGMLEAALSANFHSVLDARYAISDGIIWAAFLHPLADLSETLFISAISQVATAKVTFGADFAGGGLQFQP